MCERDGEHIAENQVVDVIETAKQYIRDLEERLEKLRRKLIAKGTQDLTHEVQTPSKK